MSFIDVETSAEAIQEDEELIEAVENLVETAAVSIKSEIVSSIQDATDEFWAWFEWLFPLWVAYRQDESLFWIDLQRLACAAVLLAISCLLLEPSSSRRSRSKDRRRQLSLVGRHSFKVRRHSSIAETVQLRSATSFGGPTQQSKFSSQASGVSWRQSSICSGRVVTEEEESDQEKFEKHFHRIVNSSYSRLVLPPACKLVEKPKRQSNKDKKKDDNIKNKKQKSRRKKRDKGDEDQPWTRLQRYFQNLVSLLQSIMTYDYMGAGRTLIHWLDTVLRQRELRRSNSHPELPDEDDDDDDESKASASASVSTRNNMPPNSTHSAPQTPVRMDFENSLQSGQFVDCEEKKESPLSSSVRSTTAQTPPPFSLEFISCDINSSRAASLSTPARRGSETSNLSTPSSAIEPTTIGEADETHMASLRLPLSANTSAKTAAANFQPRASVGGKKKDLLENYRAPGNTILANSNRAVTSTLASKQLQSRSSSGDQTEKHRNKQDKSGKDDVGGDENVAGSLERATQVDDNDGHMDDNLRQRTNSDFSAFFFETASNQESLQQMVIEAPLPDKNGYIVGDEFLPDFNCTPLLVFVNSRSGPQQGHMLITQLRRLLNPIQVWDLGEDGSPETVLESFCAFRNLRILVCGGDGTVSWIIATLEKLKLNRKWPPIAILPLGTGNDLARIHGWGGGYNNESLIGILEQVADSYISLLDRWEMTIENRKGKVKEVKSFFNYLGVGADAQAALQVHMLRESKPQLFFSRVVNKAWYGIFGAEDIIKATSLNLPNEITLIADGVEVPLPPDSQGIILLNIDSYAGGASMWATGVKNVGSHMNGYEASSNNGVNRPYPNRMIRRAKSLEDLASIRDDQSSRPMDRIDSIEDLTQLLPDDQRYEKVTACDGPSSCQDGILEVVSIRGAFHLGQVRVGLSSAQRVCQCREATIHIKRKVAVQIDGEPWRQNICTLKVKRKPDRAIMLHRSADKHGVETEVAKLLDWAEENKLINATVHYTMMKEFSRRIEHKTRQRRNKGNDNLMVSLKRAIGSTGTMAAYGVSYD